MTQENTFPSTTSRRAALKALTLGAIPPTLSRFAIESAVATAEGTIEVVPVGRDATYYIEVSGAIEPADINGRDTNEDDTIRERSVTGKLLAGYQGDSYRFTGVIREISILDGDAKFLVNGSEVDLADYRQDTEEHTLQAMPLSEEVTYHIEVSGRILPANINGRDTNPDDNIGDNVVDGKLFDGYQGDSYWFTGQVIEIALLDGDAQFLVDGETYPANTGRRENPQPTSPECLLDVFRQYSFTPPEEYRRRSNYFLQKAKRSDQIRSMAIGNRVAIEALEAIAELHFGDYGGALKEFLELLYGHTNTLAEEEADTQLYQSIRTHSDHAAVVYNFVNGPTESVHGYADTMMEAVALYDERDTDSLKAAIKLASGGSAEDHLYQLAVEVGELPLVDAVSGLEITAQEQLIMKVFLESQLPILRKLEQLAIKRDKAMIQEAEMYAYFIYQQEYWSSWARAISQIQDLHKQGRDESALFWLGDEINKALGNNVIELSEEGAENAQRQYEEKTRNLVAFRNGALEC